MNMIHHIVEPYRKVYTIIGTSTLNVISMFRLDPEVIGCPARCKNPRHRRARLKCWIVECEDRSETGVDIIRGRP